MKNLRKYGKPPFKIAVIHGGPGAPGYMAPVARELSSEWGVLEPLQTAASLEGQVQELRYFMEKHGDPPVTMIGSSWGAMLSFIFGARFPALTKKLILIGSGVFEEEYAGSIIETRLSRLNVKERADVMTLLQALENPEDQDKDALLAQLADVFNKTDSYNPMTLDLEVLECQFDINTQVWNEARELRISGKLLALGKHIPCPVVAIHGDYDPHPALGIREPLSRVLKDFQFHLLKHCGHYPWIEKDAREEFYLILKQALNSD